jgi:methylmalonyl-CoA/ethylmalonyl-CoA epimerase
LRPELGVTPTPTRLHHVGIVVPSDERAAELMALLHLEESHRGYVEEYSATCIFTKGNGGSMVEFVVPTGGTLTRFNRGVGGLHHVAFVVDDLRDLARELSEQETDLLEAEPVQGAGDFLCNFLPPAKTRGVIVEFIQELAQPVAFQGSV